MIYYAKSHRDGAKTLAKEYSLRPLSHKKYISESTLRTYGKGIKHRDFFDAVAQHKEVHAYVLMDLVMHFHPDALLAIVGVAYQKYFKDFV